MIVLDTTIVNVALPDIAASLGFGQSDLTWVINAYLITFGSLLLLAGRLGDLIGRKKVFLAGLALFTAASLACGLAGDQATLIAARFVQGIGGAAAASVIMAIIVTDFPEPGERARAISFFTVVAVGGGSAGLLLGGVITQAVDWHWIFVINVPIGVLAMALGARLISENEGLGIGRGVDWGGSALVTVALMLGVYSIVEIPVEGWNSAHTLGVGTVALVALTAFGVLQARHENPILPPRVLSAPGLLSSSVLRGLAFFGMFGAFFLGTLLFERVHGYDELSIGASFLPQTLAVAALSLGITTRLVGRFGTRRLLAPGFAAIGAGLVLLALAGQDTAFFPEFFLAYMLIGLGAGTVFMPLMSIAMEDVDPADAGVASGFINLSQQVSGALGVAVLGTIATSRTDHLRAAGDGGAHALMGGYQLAFVVAAVMVTGAVGISIWLARSRTRHRSLYA